MSERNDDYILTVGQLRKAMKGVPDDMPIIVMCDVYTKSDLHGAYVGKPRRWFTIEEPDMFIMEVQG